MNAKPSESNHHRRVGLRAILAALGVCLLLPATAADQPGSTPVAADAATPRKKKAAITPEQLEFFEKKIRPVLVTKCYECHSEEIGRAHV